MVFLALQTMFAAPVLAHQPEAVAIGEQLMPAEQRPEQIKDVGIDEKLGQKLDLNLQMADEEGNKVSLGSFFDGKTPVILSPVYFSCPGLCNFHLNGLITALHDLDWSVGNQFKVIAFSFDPKEGPALAKDKKANYMKSYGRPGTEHGWHFLTGSPETVTALMGSVGFKYKWNEEAKEWAHTSSAIVVSPDGVITRYLPGIQFETKDVRLALLEATKGKVGNFVDQLVLYCFHYNPQQSRYTIYAFNIMKLAGLVVILGLGFWLFPYVRRQRRSS